MHPASYHNNTGGGLIHWLDAHLLQCPIKQTFHVDCPGCGLQRAVVDLLQLHIAASWHVYPPGIFIVATIALLIIHLLFPMKHGAALLKWMYIICILALIINYTYKILTKQIY